MHRVSLGFQYFAGDPEMYPLGMMGFLVWDSNSSDIGKLTSAPTSVLKQERHKHNCLWLGLFDREPLTEHNFEIIQWANCREHAV